MVYDLVRSVMGESAKVQGVAPEQVSLLDALRWLVGAEGDEDLSVLLVNSARLGRVGPRVVKRRSKQYPRMTKPQSVLRKGLLDKEVAA